MTINFKILAAILLLCGIVGHSAAESLLLPPNESVATISQEDWSRIWWQWAGSFENDDSPVSDTTGARCSAKQSGDVWFLAGTYGSKRTVRECVVPRGKYLFFPLINIVVMPPSARRVSCKAVQMGAADDIDQVTKLVLDIDGVRYADLEAHRLSTRECFDIGIGATPKVKIFPSAADGYYVMIRPLPPGKHTLNFGGISANNMQAITYTLIVK